MQGKFIPQERRAHWELSSAYFWTLEFAAVREDASTTTKLQAGLNFHHDSTHFTQLAHRPSPQDAWRSCTLHRRILRMAGLSADASLKLLQSGQFADFTVICEGKEIKVHRMIVCAQSREWSAACDGTLIVDSSSHLRAHSSDSLQGFPTSRAEICSHDLATVSRVLLFLHTGDYDDKVVPDLGKALPGIDKLESYAQLSSDDESTLFEESEGTQEIKSELHNKGKRDDAVTDKTLGSQLVVNAKVYLCAKTLKIDDLLTLALERFMSLAHARLSVSVIVAVATFIFEDCKTNDVELRAEMFRVCLKRIASVKSEGCLVQLLQMHEPLAWTLLKGAEETRSKLASTLEEGKKATAQSIQSGEKLVADVKRLTAENKRLAAAVSAKNDEVNELFLEEQDQNSDIEKLRVEISKQVGVVRTKQERIDDLVRQSRLANKEAREAKHRQGAVRDRNTDLEKEAEDIKAAIDRFGAHMGKRSWCQSCNVNFGANMFTEDGYKRLRLYCGHCDKNN